MSLATRCTSCGTAFRVVQDQLKISEAGSAAASCNAVFNALEGLFDLGRDAAARTGRRRAATGIDCSAAGTTSTALDDEPPADRPRSDDDELADERGPDLEPRRAARRSDRRPSLRPAQARRERAQAGRPDRRARPGRFLRIASRTPISSPRTRQTTEDETLMMSTSDAGALPLESSVQPEFVRRAERQARWRSKGMRSALGAASVAGARGARAASGSPLRHLGYSNIPRCTGRSSRGVASPAARCRRRGASTMFWSRAPR